MLLWSGGREEISQRPSDLGAHRRPGCDHVDHGHRRAGVSAGQGETDRYPGSLQGARVGNTLVAQRVEVPRPGTGPRPGRSA